MMAATTGSAGVVFSVLSALLDCLDPPTQRALSEARTLLNAVRALPLDMRAGLDRLIGEYAQHDLTTLQECYVVLFDCGRATSLYLLERVHGEPHDCGQAMVDLLNMCEKQGLHLWPGKLSDYLPVLLEYPSRLPKKEARNLLAETGETLRAITTRLTEWTSRYRLVVDALLPLTGIRHSASSDGESTGDDVDAPPGAADHRVLDAAYADEPVHFVGTETPVIEPFHSYDKRPGHLHDLREPR